MQQKSSVNKKRRKAMRRDQQPRNDEDYFNHPSKEDDLNEIAKVYHINTYGQFTVIVRSSLIRLRLRPTTKSQACYSCDLNKAFPSPAHGYFDPSRKRKQWRMMNERTRKFIFSNRKPIAPSTTIVYSCMLSLPLTNFEHCFETTSEFSDISEVNACERTPNNDHSPGTQSSWSDRISLRFHGDHCWLDHLVMCRDLNLALIDALTISPGISHSNQQRLVSSSRQSFSHRSPIRSSSQIQPSSRL